MAEDRSYPWTPKFNKNVIVIIGRPIQPAILGIYRLLEVKQLTLE